MRPSIAGGAYTLSIEAKARGRGGSRIIAARRALTGRAVARRGASGSRAPQQEIREQRCRPSGAAFLGPALVGGAGDVEMRPLQSLRELAEEAGRRDRPAVTPADVGQVGEVAHQCLREFVGELRLPAR